AVERGWSFGAERLRLRFERGGRLLPFAADERAADVEPGGVADLSEQAADDFRERHHVVWQGVAAAGVDDRRLANADLLGRLGDLLHDRLEPLDHEHIGRGGAGLRPYFG